MPQFTSRRTFILGLGAAVATAALGTPLAIADQVARCTLAPILRRRFVTDLMVYFDPGEDDKTLVVAVGTTKREVLHMPLHVKSFFRWRAVMGSEIFVFEDESLVVRLTPAPAKTFMTMISFPNYPPPGERAKFFAETFEWHRNDLVHQYTSPLDPQDDWVDHV